jgi:hypothetical protein
MNEIQIVIGKAESKALPWQSLSIFMLAVVNSIMCIVVILSLSLSWFESRSGEFVRGCEIVRRRYYLSTLVSLSSFLRESSL